MNIVKLKDVIIEPFDPTDCKEKKKCDRFNEYFKGKYVYALNWKYCIPLEELTTDKFVELSFLFCRHLVYSRPNPFNVDILDKYHWLKLEFIQPYIDEEETDKINDVEKWIEFNKFIASDITIDQIKKFRTWLASKLLEFNLVLDEKTRRMLEYYAGGMYDETVKSLVEFGTTDVLNNLSPITTNTCGCQTNNVVLPTNTLGLCDALAIYRHNIYKYMVEVFSNIDFWMELDPEFLTMFKKYIDGIIEYNLPLRASSYTDDFVDCTCKNTGDTLQDMNMNRLKRLSKSLGYMIENSLSKNRQYASKAFSEWATYLYEIMEW